MQSRQAVLVGAFALIATATVWASPPAGGADQPVPFSTLQIGSRSGIHTRTNLTIKAQAQWRTLWQQHTVGTQPRPPLPAVDFSREMVVAVFAGSAPLRTKIVIETITVQKGQLTAVARITYDQSRREFNLTGGPDAPYHIVRLPRSSLRVVFVIR